MLRKNACTSFGTDSEESQPNREIRFPQKSNKRRFNVFCSKTEAILHRDFLFTKFKDSISIQVEEIFGSIISECIFGSKDPSITSFPCFPVDKVKLFFPDSMTFFMLSNLAMWFVLNTVPYRFGDACMLRNRFWAPVGGISLS